jgi:hypothetical protein
LLVVPICTKSPRVRNEIFSVLSWRHAQNVISTFLSLTQEQTRAFYLILSIWFPSVDPLTGVMQITLDFWTGYFNPRFLQKPAINYLWSHRSHCRRCRRLMWEMVVLRRSTLNRMLVYPLTTIHGKGSKYI